MKLKDKSIEGIPAETMARALQHFRRQEQVRQAVTAELQALRPSFGVSDPEKVAAHMELFTKSITDRFEFELDDAGTIMLFQNGTRLENPQAYPLTLGQLVRQEAERQYALFSPDGPTPKGAPVRFKDSKDYIDRYYAAKSHEERAHLVQSWQAQNAQ
jgi:hypothetical protein